MSDQFLGKAIECAEIGGQLLVEYFDKVHDAVQKNQNTRDLVTSVDIIIEERVKKLIRTSFPDHSIRAEESGEDLTGSDYCWHVDPIDGTVNYSRGIPICAISVGLEYKGQIILGALNNPFSSEAYYASLGAGAFLNGQRIYVSTENKLEHGLYVAAFSSKIEDVGQYRAFGVLNDSSRGVLRIGSVAVALAYLACGRIDGLWASKLHSWDLAAGLILVKEAGGVTTDVAGEEFALRGQSCVASNGSLHTDLIMTLQNGCFLEACK